MSPVAVDGSAGEVGDTGMGCMTSSQRIRDSTVPSVTWREAASKNETIVSALSRLDEEIAASEKSHPTARLAVVAAELESIQQEIVTFESSTTTTAIDKDSYAKTLHQLFVGIDLYRRPVLASENEDFVANVNRKEMRRMELDWLRARRSELQRERRVLHAQILRTRALYAQLQHLLDSVWGKASRPGSGLEDALGRAQALRDALAAVSARLRAAAEYAHAAVRQVDDGLPAWKLTSVGKSGWERTCACADACSLLVRARCLERGARRVLAAPAAPRAARSLRLALDYAFTDALHDHRYQRATEVFLQFKEALIQLVNSIHQVNVPKYLTVLQACRLEGIALPTFCYHDRLSIAGNCRMCLVEFEGVMKPQIACSSPVFKNMRIRTNSQKTLQAQESVLEFLLINHPLDCPICDQGGECDLQDLSMRFGSDRSRYTDIHFSGKRAVETLNLGPLIATEMTRCIHCTRCVRFGAQVCGFDVLGTSGRGTDMLVGTYVEKMFLSELSGNVIDLCPVGALTSAPYAFRARPWELRRTNSIDVTDAAGTNIVLNAFANRVVRVLPRENDEVNQEWLSDKGRWAIDSLDVQRLVSPMYRVQGFLTAVEWDCALKVAGNFFRCTPPEKIMAIAGPYCNVETLVVAKDFLNMLGSENTFIERDLQHSFSGADIRAGYSLNINMQDVAQADKILLIGTNPRFEAPILNTWIRQAYLFNEADIYYVGEPCSFNYFANYLGASLNCIANIANDASFKSAKHPLIFIGASQLALPEAGIIMKMVYDIVKSFGGMKPGWIPLHVIPREASWAGALECGWKPGGKRALNECHPNVLLLLGADQVVCNFTPCKCTVIYVGFQGSTGACIADIILPGAAYTESGGLYLNMECRSQYAYPAVTPPGKARHDWKILRALAEYSGLCMFYSDKDSLACRMGQISPNFTYIGNYQPKLFSELVFSLLSSVPSAQDTTLQVDMKTLPDYYCSDPFTYNSPTMIRAQRAASEASGSAYAKV